jgi:cyclopropane fatty-acyl-phospholipid synthase-like methyltransferase
MACPNDKDKIRKHYDVVSPYYQSLWGQHIHHGYWIRGYESKEQAQLQLIGHLAQVAGLLQGCTILDVGCGFGGTAIYLAKNFGAKVTGITISQVQVEMANSAAKRERADAKFFLMDAEEMNFDQRFDVVWSTESVSHYQDVPKFFAGAARVLKPAGILALTDWFQKEKLTASESKKFISPIERSMMVELHTMQSYEEWMRDNGLNLTAREILNAQCAKTWDISLDIIKEREFWRLAAKKGREFVRFLRGFSAMRAAFASGNFVYGLLVAHRSENAVK